MTRSLTQNQQERRSRMLERLKGGRIESASELRAYLARYFAIHVTVDTIQRDLNAMLAAGSVRRVRHPSAGHYMGNGSWMADRGWEYVE